MQVRPILSFLLAISMAAAVAQSAAQQTTWRIDSLVTTWPVRLAMEEARHEPVRGVIRAVDTRELLAQLRIATPDLPVFTDSNVVAYVQLYGEPRREEFRAVLGAAQYYFPMIENALAVQGLPNDLKYLPMALSAMNTLAGSPNGEAGLWMLNYPVAIRYGLHVDAVRDERRDPYLATVAATHYLKDLHARYKDWGLAVMAFTCGPTNVTRAQQRTHGSKDLRILYPQFTDGHRDVLPLLMACIHLSAQAKKLGIAPLDVMPFEASDSLRAESELRFQAIATTLGMPVSRLRAINPMWCNDRVPALERFQLPRGERERFAQLTDSIARVQRQLIEAPVASTPVERSADGREAIHYRVRSGDYLGRIAMRFGVRVSQIKTWNKLRSDRISAGDKLVIYVPASQRARYERHASSDDDGPTNSTAPTNGGTTVRVPSPVADFTWYTVQAGDSLYAIARRYPGLEAKDLMKANGISADIHPGQKLKIPAQP